MPDELWRESWTHAQNASGGTSQYRAHRLRYLAVHAVRGHPSVFGLSETDARPWREAYEICLRNHLAKEEYPSDDPHYAPELLEWPTLWTRWDQAFADTPVALPACSPANIREGTGRDELCRRQVARTVLGQVFRLTDTLLDLYFADEAVGRVSVELADRVLKWLNSTDPGARQVHDDIERWIHHLRLIVDSCLDGAGRPWHELARENEEAWINCSSLHPWLASRAGRAAIAERYASSEPRRYRG